MSLCTRNYRYIDGAVSTLVRSVKTPSVDACVRFEHLTAFQIFHQASKAAPPPPVLGCALMNERLILKFPSKP